MDTKMTVIQKCIEGLPETSGVEIAPHPNIAFCRKQGTCSDEDYSSIIKLNQTLALEDFEKYDDRSTTTILCQITHAVNHIHKNGWAHGEIRLKNLMLTENKERVLLKHPTAVLGQTATSEEQKKDINDMREVFESIIKKRRRNPSRQNDPRHEENESIEDDLLTFMPANTCKAILQHPFFWITQKKISFLRAVAGKSKEEKGKRLKDAINIVSTKVFSREGWKAKLEIRDPQEIDKYENELKKRKRNGEIKITQIRDELKRNKYCELELQSLVRFIRNLSEHFGEVSKAVHACFMFDPHDGFWNFFSRRFPKLFITVYNEMKKYSQQWADTELDAEFFETMAENVDGITMAENVDGITMAENVDGITMAENVDGRKRRWHIDDRKRSRMTQTRFTAFYLSSVS